MMRAKGQIVVISEDELLDLVSRAASQAAEETARRLMPANKLRPPHVTQAQAAEMVGCSAPTIKKMTAAGTFSLNSFGMIPIEQIDAAISAGKTRKAA